MRTKTFRVKLALVVLTLLFIWGNSVLPGSVSGRESGFVLRLCEPLVDALQRLLSSRGVELSQEHIIRKLAHFTEYVVLGVLMLSLFVRPGLRFRMIPPAMLCLGAALMDEGIQIFAMDRGPSLRDVGLDFCGAVCGIALSTIAVLLLRSIRRTQ